MMYGTLTEREENWAWQRAETLQKEAWRDRRENRYGAGRMGSYEAQLNLHYQGQRGEIFAARCYGVDATPKVNVFHSHVPDIGESGQVRTRSKNWHDLIVRPDDAEDFYYVLVIGTDEPGSQLNLIGGIWGSEARRDEWFLDPSGDGKAWFVPKSALLPPEQLPKGWVLMVLDPAMWEKVRQAILERDVRCFRCLDRAADVHHRRVRGAGGTKNDETNYGYQNLVALCRFCHDWVHRNVARAYRDGYLVHSWQRPEEVPIKIERGNAQFLLNADCTKTQIGGCDPLF